MTVHYCSKCGSYNWKPSEGTRPWAIECSECGHVEAQNPHPPVEEPPVFVLIPALGLDTMTKEELAEQAEALGLPTSGRKADLIDRLREATES